MISNKCIIFEYRGKYAHFLRAEANASAPSYPFPSRTILLGLVGSILGLSKDSPQVVLKGSNFAVKGQYETTHWHTANLRKDFPASLPEKINKNDKGTSKKQRNTIITQEWLFRPDFTVFAQLPDDVHNHFENRVKKRKWHFSPCLGLSEMMADIEFVDSVKVESLEKNIHKITTLMQKKEVQLDMDSILKQNLAIKSIRMPRDVTTKRKFVHENYLYEARGKELIVKTKSAFLVGDQVVSWL